MATNDLIDALKKPDCSLDDSNEQKVVKAVFKKLEDSNGEVQNLAVKALAPLAKKVKEKNLQDIVDKLCNLLKAETDSQKDIASIGLKTVIVEVPVNSTTSASIVAKLIPKLLDQMRNENLSVDTIDILSEVLNRFGNQLVPGEASSAGPQLQKQIQNALLHLLNHKRFAIRKRTTVAIGSLVAHTSDELFAALIKDLLAELRAKEQREDWDRLRTHVGCLATVCSPRFGPHLNEFLPLVVRFTVVEENDELREYCLNALESFVLRCPKEIGEHIKSVVDLAIEYVKYDPNYDAGDGDEGMEVDAEEDDDDFDDADDIGYSDDDDMSWKVRRASSKLLSSVISTRSEILVDLLDQVAPVLVNRFKEREESVRVDILNTFIVLIQRTGRVAGGVDFAARNDDSEHSAKRRKGTNGVVAMEGVTGPKDHLRQHVPRLSTILAKQMNDSSAATRQTGFALLKELVIVLNGALENHIGAFIPAIESSLSGAPTKDAAKTSTSSNLKLELLEFLRVLLTTHRPEVFHPHLGRLVPPVITAANDKFYKITGEALTVANELVKVIRPFAVDKETNQQHVTPLASNDFLKHLEQIYAITVQRLGTTDADLEVKERSVVVLGTLLSQTGDILPADQVTGTVLSLLLERLRNELTRLTTVRVFRSVAESPLTAEGATSVNIVPVLSEVAKELASYLRKSHRQLRLAALQTLETILKRFGRQLPTDVYPTVLAELRPLLTDADLHVLPLTLAVLAVVVQQGQSAQGLLKTVQEDVLKELISMIIETPHLVGSGAGGEALQQLWKALSRTADRGFQRLAIAQLEQKVADPKVTFQSKQTHSVIAQSIAVLSLGSEAEADTTINNHVAALQAGNDQIQYLALLTIGEIGRKIDLSKKHPKLKDILLKNFSSTSEEIKQASAFALGNVAVGNLDEYLPGILNIVDNNPKQRYLALVSLREVIARVSGPDASPPAAGTLERFAQPVWDILFKDTKDTEDATRNVIAECLGKLSLLEPGKFLPELRSRLSGDATIRATVVTAVRFTFSEHCDGGEYDALLAPFILDFLRLVQDDDNDVRRVSLATLNAAAHNKPHLIQDALPELLPLLYGETIVREELIETVEMGPFKHQVDHGLEARKSAFECMSTLLETCSARLDLSEFLARVVLGLKDPASEIKTLAYLMLQRLVQVGPSVVTQHLDSTVEPLRTAVLAKPKQNAVKQEIEKNAELVRSAARTVVVLAPLAENAGSTKFDEFLREVRGPTSPVLEVMNEVGKEVEQVGTVGLSGPTAMDLS
ncbi:Cullin-associated NEDD8-dissociated protein 1 [Rhizophlyctis rosea]|uniref:Cullin-associated NEDD8-dissociated protein 1 n=1 Tax=Rhizophlyctis rosea TaxID=64517 RepID=A0AAD5SKP2_9FUNG|nr:Cullin-associated NEDD8-dissociated protein 1 [Rhizophlyctis rosea]